MRKKIQPRRLVFTIPGWENDYAASASGKIFSIKNGHKRYKEINLYLGGKRKALKPRLNRNGYERVNLSVPGKALKTMTVHRLVWMAHNQQDIPADLEIDHIDRNRSNNCIQNLRLVTRDENLANSNKAKRPVKVYWYDHLKPISHVYPSLLEAARAHKLNPGSVSQVCMGLCQRAFSKTYQRMVTCKYCH